MGSTGYTERKTRKAFGPGVVGWGYQLVYTPEPLEPMFGLDMHLPPLPPPDPHATAIAVPVARQQVKRELTCDDKYWITKELQSGPVTKKVRMFLNTEGKVVKEAYYTSLKVG